MSLVPQTRHRVADRLLGAMPVQPVGDPSLCLKGIMLSNQQLTAEVHQLIRFVDPRVSPYVEAVSADDYGVDLCRAADQMHKVLHPRAMAGLPEGALSTFNLRRQRELVRAAIESVELKGQQAVASGAWKTVEKLRARLVVIRHVQPRPEAATDANNLFGEAYRDPFPEDDVESDVDEAWSGQDRLYHFTVVIERPLRSCYLFRRRQIAAGRLYELAPACLKEELVLCRGYYFEVGSFEPRPAYFVSLDGFVPLFADEPAGPHRSRFAKLFPARHRTTIVAIAVAAACILYASRKDSESGPANLPPSQSQPLPAATVRPFQQQQRQAEPGIARDQAIEDAMLRRLWDALPEEPRP